jgi:acetyl esterase/lipase
MRRVHVLDRPAPAPDRIDAYADRRSAVVDLFDPPGKASRAVILLHGGFWRAAYDRTHLRILAAALAADGARVALPEYRRVGEPGGGAPGTIDDAREILQRVPEMLDVAASDVVVGGHSAGGHLAMLAAARAARPPGRVVSLAGVLDVRAAHEARLSGGAVAELLQPAAPTAASVAAIDPMVLPIPACEVHLVHGVRDDQVPDAYSRAFSSRSERVVLDLLDDADHYDLIDPESIAYTRVRAAMR